MDVYRNGLIPSMIRNSIILFLKQIIGIEIQQLVILKYFTGMGTDQSHERERTTRAEDSNLQKRTFSWRTLQSIS